MTIQFIINHLIREPSRLHMKFYLISKSNSSKYESSKPSVTSSGAKTPKPRPVKISVTPKVDTKSKTFIRNYFKEKRELKRRINQAVQRNLKRALLQLKN